MPQPGAPALLIVDDSATIRKMIITALRPLNASFTEASSGLEAIEQLALRSYDAVTLDLNMPDMHGMDFLNFVRGHQMFHHVPILVVSTRSDEGIRAAVLSAGANAYLSKPFKPDEVLTAVQQILEP